GLATVVADQIHGLLGRLERAVHDHHQRALPGEHDGGGPPVAHRLPRRLSTAHDDRRFALDALRHDWKLPRRSARGKRPWRRVLSDAMPEERITPGHGTCERAPNIERPCAMGARSTSWARASSTT